MKTLNQMVVSFEVTGLHNIQILRGLTTGNNILSGDAGGSILRLNTVDNDSGLEQWEVTAVPQQAGPTLYTLALYKGVPNAPLYLTYDANGGAKLAPLDQDSDTQLWELKPVVSPITPSTYNIKASDKCLSSRFLSCSIDGQIVGLFGSDDNTGRQRWQFQEIWING